MVIVSFVDSIPKQFLFTKRPLLKMSLYRVIIQGRLDFSTEKSYDKAKKMYQYRLENYFKSDCLFKEADEIFNDEAKTLDIPRFVGQAFEKTFKNTVSLLDYCAQFAMMGVIKAWQTDSGTVLNYADIEPKSDKVAVQLYQKGKKLSKKDDKQEEAFAQLTKAIDKYDKHAQAYERRGNVNLKLKKYADAIRDFKKTISIDPSNPFAYFGLAKVYIIKEDYAEAIDQLELVCKKSLALQSIYWKARRLKADCHFKIKEYDKAEFDLKLFTKRHFEETDPNYAWKRHALYFYGRVLFEQEKFAEAIPVFQEAIDQEEGIDTIPLEDMYFHLGSSKKNAGKNGYVSDLKKASDMGSKFAVAALSGSK